MGPIGVGLLGPIGVTLALKGLARTRLQLLGFLKKKLDLKKIEPVALNLIPCRYVQRVRQVVIERLGPQPFGSFKRFLLRLYVVFYVKERD